jgi:hypothetical protein
MRSGMGIALAKKSLLSQGEKLLYLTMPETTSGSVNVEGR